MEAFSIEHRRAELKREHQDAQALVDKLALQAAIDGSGDDALQEAAQRLATAQAKLHGLTVLERQAADQAVRAQEAAQTHARRAAAGEVLASFVRREAAAAELEKAIAAARAALVVIAAEGDILQNAIAPWARNSTDDDYRVMERVQAIGRLTGGEDLFRWIDRAIWVAGLTPGSAAPTAATDASLVELIESRHERLTRLASEYIPELRAGEAA